MPDQPRKENTPPESEHRAPPRPDGKDAAPAASDTGVPTPPVKKLTPEEQMALYEDDLKENDWGHQPC